MREQGIFTSLARKSMGSKEPECYWGKSEQVRNNMFLKDPTEFKGLTHPKRVRPYKHDSTFNKTAMERRIDVRSRLCTYLDNERTSVGYDRVSFFRGTRAHNENVRHLDENHT